MDGVFTDPGNLGSPCHAALQMAHLMVPALGIKWRASGKWGLNSAVFGTLSLSQAPGQHYLRENLYCQSPLSAKEARLAGGASLFLRSLIYSPHKARFH